METSRLLEHPKQVQRASPFSQHVLPPVLPRGQKLCSESLPCIADLLCWVLPAQACIRQKANVRGVWVRVCCWALFGGDPVASVLALGEDPLSLWKR